MTEGLNEKQLRDRNNRIEAARQPQQIADHELIDTAPGPQDDRYPMQMMRRLKAAIGDLTARVLAALPNWLWRPAAASPQSQSTSVWRTFPDWVYRTDGNAGHEALSDADAALAACERARLSFEVDVGRPREDGTLPDRQSHLPNGMTVLLEEQLSSG